MKSCLYFALAVSAALVSSSARADDETVEIKAKDLVLNVPKTWKQEEPKSKLRLTQFAIPAADGDQEDGELSVFNFGGGGGVDANIQRWIGQFHSEGRIAKISKGDTENGQYVFVEIAGTYKKPDGPPFLRKTIDAPDYRMLAVIYAIADKGVYYLKLTGPDKTVTSQAAAFRKSIGGDAEKEKELDLKGDAEKKE